MQKLIKISILVPAALLLALVALAGCGGGDDSEAPTKAVFIKEADAICKRADDKQSSALKDYAENNSLSSLSPAKQLELAMELGIPPIQEEIDELGALTPPSGDEEKVSAVVEAIEDGLKKAEANPQSLAGGDTTNPFKAADQAAAEYGFKGCADSS